MKTYIPYSLILAAASAGMAFGAETAYTTPVGYVSLGDTTPGQPAVKANTDVYLSVPVLKSSEFTGAVSGVAGNVISITGAAFTAGQFSNPANPYYVVVESGTKSGLVAVVSANGTGDVTAMVQVGDSLTGVASGDRVTLRKAWTVGSFLGSSLPSSGVSLFTLPATGAPNPSAENIYDWDGTNWVDNVNTGAPADNDILYPGETLILRNASATPIASLVVSGEVLKANERIPLGAVSGPSDLAVSYFGAVGEPIGTSSLGSVVANGDSLLGFDNSAPGFNKAASVILDFDGTNWVDNVNTGAPDNGFLIGGGQGFILRRNSPAAAQVWSDQATYVPSL
ncbi:TIGR02597 family protein [Luteolibacter yonseiensis]|uniref:TIGR02597 family protein n=1 Tax=Luteolibacter yonseiensis TaxID=1144680 RepID=A0A934V5Y6_9BACT|nr:TIGR02597 family protein [Luteolibacter yonseiensis]MBK1814447.1 TIGR02597 family protein [Luteolibacter yonseiensis]